MSNDLVALEKVVFDGIVSGAAPSDLIDKIIEIFNVNVYFCNILGQVNIGSKTDKFEKWISGISIFQLKKNQYYKILPGIVDDFAYIVRSINRSDFLSGVVIVEGSPQMDEHFMSSLADLLSDSYCFYDIKEKNNAPVLNDSLSYMMARELLLSNEDITEGLIRNNEREFGTLKPAYNILYFLPADSKSDLKQIASQMKNFFPYSYTVENEGGIYSFIYGVKNNTENSIVFSRLLEFCQKFSLRCCISSSFDVLKSRQAYLSQVKTLLPICIDLNPATKVFSADDFYCEYLICLAGKILDPEMIEIAAIKELSKIDAENGTRYMHTLDCYLNNSNNATAASKLLFVDRTTLKYQLAKISELIGSNIEDPQTALKLRLGLLIRKTLHSGSLD